MKNLTLALGFTGLALLCATQCLAQESPPAGQGGDYEVVHHGTQVLGHFWAGDGIGVVSSSNGSVANRFQFGAQIQFGGDYQFLLGWTLLDLLASGENTPGTGEISRVGTDLNAGYFIIPQKLWIEYSLYLGEIRGNNIGGHANNNGQGLSVGYRFYDKDKISLALEAAYAHITSETVPIFNVQTQQTGTAYYPFANVWTLSLQSGLTSAADKLKQTQLVCFYREAVYNLAMRNLIRILVVAAVFLSFNQAHAAVTPLSVSVLSPVEFPPESFSVVGARVSLIWGDHRDVYGLDVGAIGNMTDNNFVGIGVSGIFNLNKGMTTVVGLQAAGLTNINVNKANIVGLQVAAILNSNQAESSLVGFQVALGNYSPFTTVWGAQLGLYNRAQVVNGFQIGLVNVAQSLHGIQIGLVNFNQTGLFSVAPILNIGF